MHLMLKILEQMQFPSARTPMLCHLVDQRSYRASEDSEINTDDWNLNDNNKTDIKISVYIVF